MAKNEVETPTNQSVEKLRTALAELGLNKVDEIKSGRARNAEEMINALANMFNAIK